MPETTNNIYYYGQNLSAISQYVDVVIPMITFNDVIDQDETHYGLKGSPTQVERMFPPERNTDKVVLTGSLSEQVDKLTEILKNKKYI